ncbi:MAG: molybdopterin-synthase adenylyltransferase [Solirubrobacteraceae bacterium]|nr:molybdopterin-synthase adenylyltransferase [Solirubrobacteraceae bacterium]
MKRPLLPSHYSVWFEPPDERGDEVLHVVSERRTLRLKGYAFREFCERVVPLLDGSRSLEQIHESTGDVFEPEDLDRCLALLRDQGVVVDAAANGLAPEARERLTPQLNLFHDLAPGEDLQRRLASAHVAILGMSGAGPSAALALAAAGVGTISCHDPLPVVPADVYYAPFLGTGSAGSGRAERVAELIRAAAPEVAVAASDAPLEEEDDVRRAIDGADFVVCCLDAAQSNLAFKLNRVCLADGRRWIACALAGAEVVVGPAMHPGESACYLCYRMRTVAAAGNPEEAFAHERYLDQRRRDDSGARENLVFGAGVAGNLVGAEVVKELTGLGETALVGRILVVRLTDLKVSRHAVLRKPGCPACYPASSDGS